MFDSLQHVGLITIVFMWSGTLLLLKFHKPERNKTISKHASKNSKYHVSYALVELVVILCFAIFLFGWLIPAKDLGAFFSMSVAIGIIGALIAAAIPDTNGWKGAVHGIAAYTMALSLLTASLALTASETIAFSARVVSAIAACYMIFGLIVAIVNKSFYYRHVLAAQVIYFIVFQVAILSTTYL